MFELLADFVHIVGESAHAHYAANADVFHLLKGFGIKQLTGFVQVKTKLGFLQGDVELQQAIHHTVVFLGLLVDGLKQVSRINAMDEGDVWDDVFDLVGLQMADKVPLDILRQYLVLVAHLLWVVLSKDTLTGIVCFL